MITSIIAGTITKIIADFFAIRKQKAEQKINLDFIEQQHLHKIELNQQQYELGLKIEEEKTRQTDIENKAEVYLKNFEQNSQNEKFIYTKTTNWIINLIALMKPIITIFFCIAYLIILATLYKNTNSSQFIEILQNTGYFEIVDGVVGFWFGFYSSSLVSVRKNTTSF